MRENRNFIKRLLETPFLKAVYSGLGVEFVRDLAKMGLMFAGGIGLTIVATGMGNLTWSLKSFNLFGAVNEVNAPNQKIANESVYEIPLGTSVRLETGAFLALSRGHRDQIQAVVTSSSGQRERQYINPSSPLFETFGCDRVGVQLMENPTEEASSVLVLYTVERVSSEDCSGFLQKIFG